MGMMMSSAAQDFETLASQTLRDLDEVLQREGRQDPENNPAALALADRALDDLGVPKDGTPVDDQKVRRFSREWFRDLILVEYGSYNWENRFDHHALIQLIKNKASNGGASSD